MSRFGGLDAKAAAKAAPQAREPANESTAAPSTERARSQVAKAREGKKPVIGYYSEDLSRELKLLSAKENTTMQALLGEAIDLLLVSRGINRFGER